jgi:large repetitive protein
VNNAPPVANAGLDQTLTATGSTTPVTLHGSGSDVDGEALTYSWTQGSTVLGNTATLGLSLSIGTYTFTLTVTDAGGLSASAVTHVTVNNAPPVANAGPDQTLTATGATTSVTLHGSGSDPDGEALTYSWTQGSTVLGNTPTLPLSLAIGTYTFTLTVTDAGGLSASAVTHVTINNAPPVANAGSDQTLTATGPTTPVTLQGSGSDPDGEAVTFAWTQGSTVLGNSATLPLNLAIGTYTFTLTVTDAGGLSASSVTHVTINNAPPVANAGPDQTLTATGVTTSVTLHGSGSDVDGEALTFSWTQGTTVIGNSAVLPVNLKVGTYTFTLTVTDAGGLSASAVTHVTVNNAAPVANAGADQTLTATGSTTPVTLHGSGSDVDGDALTFVWTQGTTVVGNSAVLPLNLAIGGYTFTLTVTDAGGLSSSAVTHVTINPRAPVAVVAADPVFECTSPTGTSVTLNGSASNDPNGYSLSYVWTDSSGHVVGNSAMVTLKLGLGTYTYTLVVKDSAGLPSGPVQTSVTVQDTTAPNLGVSLSTNARKLTNNEWVMVNAGINVSDACDANPKIKLLSITSNDPADQHVDIQSANGGAIAFGADVRSFRLRAERSKTGATLIYTVTYSATDASGNVKTTAAQINLTAQQALAAQRRH